MKILVLGDVHGSFEAIRIAYEKEKPDAILHVGDLAEQAFAERRLDVGEYPKSLPPVPFVWVLGNHDNLTTYQSVGTALGFFGVYEMKGLRIVGLGGVPGRRRSIHWGVTGVLEQLRSVERADILLSHETCSPFVHSKTGKDIGVPELSKECARLRPKFHFSGHHHFGEIQTIHEVVHYRLPYAREGYAVYEDGEVSLVS